jgi:hypothetical protein
MLTEGSAGTVVVTGDILVITTDLRFCALTEFGLRICIFIAIVVGQGTVFALRICILIAIG